MSLFAPGASLVTSAASAAVAVSPQASAAAVVKSVRFDLIEVSFREVFGGSPRTKAYLSLGSAGTDRERVGSDWRLKNSFVPWAGSRLFDNAPCRRWIEAERRRS